MKQNIIAILLLSSLFSILSANADGFNQDGNHNSKIMTSSEFYQQLGQTKPDQVAANFGVPDKIQMLRNSIGDQEGVVWVYRSAVSTPEGMRDANIIIVRGKMKYVSLSNAT
jgi:hypothetical protein